MDLDHLDEFTIVVKHGNLSEAARELHLTQPVLSRHLSALETTVGAKLLDRSKTPMELTAVGEVFLEKCVTLHSEYLKLLAFMKSMHESALETVQIGGLIDSAAQSLVRQARSLLSEQHPSIMMRVEPIQFQTPFNMLRSGELDIAIEPYSHLIDTHNLESFTLVREDAFVVVEETHPLAERESFTSADLSVLEFTSLRSNKGNAMRKHLQDLCRKNNLEGDLPKTLSLAPVDSYSELFMQGLGGKAIMLPKTIAQKHILPDERDYRAIPYAEENSQFDIRAFCLADPSTKTRAVLECLKAVMQQEDVRDCAQERAALVPPAKKSGSSNELLDPRS